ncbi:DUF6174 domain-containing protein [Lutimonas halocynthiae]|uniref:DUF6174 domain-containing protein n=1 Tax=Lutimonas halocynthiae TaxID=1446477 RepID=UPI0025B5B9BF|nr:DUF6174 domain-containing protein [Lutimonas halocynthiae]MDN3642005.1 DUF6174 domain-containing protein [Lutimonas halocynthiae]
MKPLLLVLVSLIILSCDTEGKILSDREIQLESLKKNRDLWKSQNIDHYKFNQSKICFCLFENDEFDWSIEVKKGQDAFVRYNNNLIDALPDYALSIDQLFNQIESELNRNPYPHKIVVKYNSEYGFPEMFSIDIDELIADEEYSFINSEFKIIECESKSFTGKLVLKGICMNYVIEVLDGDMDQNLIENEWTNELTNVSYDNVFALGSYCSFPENIKEGDTFQFSIETNDINQTCAVCEAYSPTPNKSLKIKVCE